MSQPKNAKVAYGDERRKWQPQFVEYMRKIVSHKNYAGLPDAIDDKGQIRWNAPSNRPPGKWQDLRDRRLIWWKKKAHDVGIKTSGKWISQVAKATHPFKEKPCQTCGKVMSLEYIYPTKNTLHKINKNLSVPNQFKYEDFLTIYELLTQLVKRISEQAYPIFINIFPELKSCDQTEEVFIKFLSKEIVPLSPRGKLSPGAMSNAPDRLDGFHTYNLCCRHKQDTGRASENLRTYTDDRRAFEFWCEGDWAAANLLMTMGGIGKCSECGKTEQMSADHVGPISLGFAHMPWFRALCPTCNSSKGNRLSARDVKALVEREKTGIRVVSFQIKTLWDQLKYQIKTDEQASKLSKLLRINQHYYLLLLKEIYDIGHPEILLILIHPELAEEKIEFSSLDTSNFTFKTLKRTLRADTYSKSKAARMIRIAFDSLDDYASKGKRNIHEIPESLELPLREKLLAITNNQIKSGNKEDNRLGRNIYKALRSALGPEERAALIEKYLNGTYKPTSIFLVLRDALMEYLDAVGSYLAGNKF